MHVPSSSPNRPLSPSPLPLVLPLPSLPPSLSSSAIMFFWADKCVLPAKPVAISRRATQPLGATSDRPDIGAGWMMASGGAVEARVKDEPDQVPSVIHHTSPPRAAALAV